MDSLGQVLDVAGVDGSDGGSGGRKNVHVELSAESLNLSLAQTGEREHTALLHNVRPVALRTALLEVLNEQGTHILDSLGHGSALALPLLEEHGVVEDGGHQASTIDGRARPEGTSTDLQLLHDVLSLLRAGGDDGDNSSTLSVETEVLGEGQGQGDVVAVLDELTEGVSVVLDGTRAVAEVGSIEEHDVVLLLAQLGNLIPLLLGGVHSGGVVSAGVEDEGRAILSLVQILEHTLVVQAGLIGGQVSVLTSGHTSVVEDGVLVGPGGVGEVHLSGDVAVLEELGQKAEGARAGHGLGVGDQILLLVVDLLTPTELGGNIVEGSLTNQRRVLVVALAAESLLSLSHAGEDVGLQSSKETNKTYLSVGVTVGTHSENDLSGVLIGLELLTEEENRIGLRASHLAIIGGGKSSYVSVGRSREASHKGSLGDSTN